MKRIYLVLIGVLNTISIYPQDNLTSSNNEFAFKIYKATKPDSSNYFISPFSLNIALSIANEGAKTTTRKEIDNLLSMSNITNRAHSYYEFVKKITNLKDSDYIDCIQWTGNKSGGNSIHLANSLWINNDTKINDSFRQTIEDNYFSEVFFFDKSNIPGEDEKLNQWVSEKTQNKIKEISGLDKDIKLSIINAIYFKGEWESPFKKKKTKEKTFYTISKDRVKIEFMNNTAQFQYFEDSDNQGIFLPYNCHQLSMIVLLPIERYGINKLEKMISSDYLDEIKKSSLYHEVILSLPKFKIETEMYPKEEIIKMGYLEMFSDKADFNNISSMDPLKINKITHKTFFEVDEKKTEAAAVTKMDMVVVGYGRVENPPPPPPPKIFNANHPFIFLIVDNRTDGIIFMGRFIKK